MERVAGARAITRPGCPSTCSAVISGTNQKKEGGTTLPRFQGGDQVWLEGTNLQLSHPSVKLVPKRYGPFKVLKEISPVFYRLELPPHWTLHNVFHASLLTPYRETLEHGINFHEPPLELIEGEEEYEVE